MKKQKRKGFTLIEVIAAMAIFAIATASITFAISSSTNAYRIENIKFETISAADNILEQLKAKGTGDSTSTNNNVTSLKDLFSSTDTTDIYKYVYFNYNELTTIILDKTNFIDLASGASGNYSDCNDQKQNGKKFGAYIHINRDNGSSTATINTGIVDKSFYYNNYSIHVEVWNLAEGDGSNSKISTSVSR